MRTRLVRIACLFGSAAPAASIAAAAMAALGVASIPARAEAKPTSSPAVEVSKAPPPETPKAPPPAAPKAPPPAAPRAAPPAAPKAGSAAPPAGARATASRASAKSAKKAKAPEPPPLPPAPARVWLIAPTPRGPWTLRIDNEGDRPMRIPADVRLLRLEIDTFDQRKKKKTFRCAAPAGLKPTGFPERRALLLAPGQSFIERFDPRLLCFGKDEAALTGGAVVRAWYGWGPPPRWSRKPPAAPFAAESTDDPPAFAPAVGLAAPTMVLSHGRPPGRAAAATDPAGGAEPHPDADDKADPSATDRPTPSAADRPAPSATDRPAPPTTDRASPPEADRAAHPAAREHAPPDRSRVTASANGPLVDANAPRLELTSEPWSDAASPRSIVVRVSARNAGRRPMTVALRPRMLEFRVDGPNGTTVCQASPPTNAIPRDMYRTLKPGASSSMSVLLKEACPGNTFDREGLYEVTATLHANETGSGVGLDAYTAVVPAKSSTLVRVKSAPEPFYSAAPRAVPTPAPESSEAPEHDPGHENE
ncbi:hypothetical protein [Sorangium cellulosum]|nr:hypothetical protein [Sorangium cellulosum]